MELRNYVRSLNSRLQGLFKASLKTTTPIWRVIRTTTTFGLRALFMTGLIYTMSGLNLIDWTAPALPAPIASVVQKVGETASSVIPLEAHAATGINEQINFQARLYNAQGAVVPDGSYNIEFKIYQDGTGCVSSGTPPCSGTLKWTEDRVYGSGAPDNRVTVKNGYFSVMLGSVTAFGSSIDWNQDTLWLSLNIGNTTQAATFAAASGDGEMTPFKRLAANPYALNSKQLGGLTSSQFVQLAQGVQTDSNTSNPSIFINKTNASGTPNIIQLQKAGVDVFTIDNGGLAAFRPASDSTSALKVTSRTSNVNVLTVDTVNNKVILANDGWLAATDSAGTGTVNIAKVNTSNQIQLGGSLVLDGGFTFPSDAGQVTLVDLPVTSAQSAGTKDSYSLRVGTSNILTVYAESDGAGGTQNPRVAIGTSISPAYTLDVTGDINSSANIRTGGTVRLDSSGVLQNVTNANAGTFFTGGTLTVARGGTGAGTFTSNGVLYGNSTSAIGVTGAGSTGQCLMGNTGSAPTFQSCSGGGSGNTLQTAYDNGNTITTTTGRDVAITLASGLASATSLTVTNNHVSASQAIKVAGANASGTVTDGFLFEQTGAGTTTSGVEVKQTAGAVTNAVKLTGTFTNLINAPNFVLNNAGQITSGTWQGTAVGPTYGGTGQTAVTSGDLLYGSASNVWSRLAVGSNGTCLTVVSGSPTWGSCAGGAGSGIDLQGAYTNSTSPATITLDSTRNGLVFTNPSSSGSAADYVLQLNQSATGSTKGGLYVVSDGGSSGYALRVDDQASDTSPFVIDNSGNIGIGSASPSRKLTVNTSGSTDDGVYLNASDSHYLKINPSTSSGAYNPLVSAGDSQIIFSNGTQGTGKLIIAPWSATAAGLAISNTGSVGIGTASPGSLLEVAGTAGQIASFASSGGATDQNYVIVGQRAEFGYNGSTQNAVVQGTSGKGIEFNVNNATFGNGTAATITSSGNVGIGTASPGNTRLVVQGSASNSIPISRVTDGTVQLDSYIGTGANAQFGTSSNHDLNFITNNATRVSILAGGNVGIGTSPQIKLALASGSAFGTEMAASGAPTLTPSASGGSLATGTYYYKITALDSNGGETVGGTEQSTAVTGPTGSVTVSWSAMNGAANYRVYRGTSSNGENVYYNVTGGAAAPSFTDTGAAGTSATPPTTNGAYTNRINASGTSLLQGSLTLQNPGIGNDARLTFQKSNDAAYVSVKETSSDATTFGFYMNDNPDQTQDKFLWQVDDFQGDGGDWQPLLFSGLDAYIRGTDINTFGDMKVNGPWYSGTDGVENTVKTTKTGTLNITPNVANFSGDTTVYWVQIDGTGSPNTFKWGTGSVGSNTQATGVSITGGAQTLNSGVTVTFSGTTGGVLNDSYQFRANKGGHLLVSDGSNTAPALSFINDTNTGIYRAGADDLRVVTGGTDRLTINSSGVVAIPNLSTQGAVYAGSGGTLNSEANLAVSRGGTGAGTFTANGVLYGNGTSALGVTAAGTTGQCLVATTSAAPSWGSCTTLTATNGLNITSNQVGLGGTLNNSTTNLTSGGVNSQINITASTNSTAVDQLVVDNTGATNGSTTAGVNNLNLKFKGSTTTAVENGSLRVDLTPGTFSGSTTNGLRVALTAAPATGTTASGFKLDTITTGGAGTYNGLLLNGLGTLGAGTETAINVQSNWDSVLTVGANSILNGAGVLQSAGLSGTYSNAVTLSNASNSITAGTLTATGGTINGTSIGASTASTGAFTTLSSSSTTTFSSFTSNGGVLYTNGSGVLAQAAAGTATQVLHGGTTPSFSAVSLANDVSGTLGVGNGGTGAGAFTQGSVVFAGASGVYSQDNSVFFFDATNDTLGVGATRSGAISGTNARLLVKGSGSTSSTSSLDVQNSGGSTALFVRDDGIVGVGTNNPSTTTKLEISSTAPDVTNGSGLKVTTTLASTSNLQTGEYLRTSLAPASASTSTFYGMFNQLSTSATNNYAGATIKGEYINPTYSGTSALTELTGVNIDIDTNGASSGIVTNGYQLRINQSASNSQFQNIYGIWIADQRSGVSGSSQYGIWQQGTNDMNVFGGNTIIGTSSADPAAKLEVGGTATSTPSGTNGGFLRVSTSSFTDNNTAASGTTNFVASSFARPTLNASNTSVTTTNASNLYVGGAPTAGTNETITNSYGIQVASSSLTNVTNGYGLRVLSTTGATNNAAAVLDITNSTNQAGLIIAKGASNITATNSLLSFQSTGSLQTTPGTSGVVIDALSLAVQDTSTAASGTASTVYLNNLSASTLSAANTSVTTTTAANLVVTPLRAHTNETITTNAAIYVPAVSVQSSGTTTNSYGALINASTDGTNRYAAAFLGGNVGIGDSTPDALFEILGTTEQLRLTNVDNTSDSRFTLDSSGNLTIDNTGTRTVIADDLRVSGNDIQDSGGSAALTFDGSANTLVNGNLTVAAAKNFLTNKGSDVSISGTVNNLSLAGALFRITTAASTPVLTGIAAGSSTSDGRHVTLVNTTANSVQINNDDASSTAGNHIITGTGANMTLAAGQSIELVYEWSGSAATSYWRVVGGVGGTGSGVTTLAAIGSSPNANGATISGNTLTLQPADGSFGGVVTTSAQTFAGTKTFNGGLVVAANQSATLNSGTGQLVVSGYSGTTDAISVTSASTSANNTGIKVSQTGATSGTDYAGYFSNSGAATTNVGLYATASGATNNYAAIFDQGNVGIGTTTPSRQLDVFQSSQGAAAFRISQTSSFYAEMGVLDNGSLNDDFRLQVTGNAGTSYLTFTDGSGKLGINVAQNTPPSYDLSFNGDAARTIKLEDATTNAAGNSLTIGGGNAGAGATGFAGGLLSLQGGNAAGTSGNANGGDVRIYGGTAVNSGSAGNVILAHNGTSAVGNVGIGTTTPYSVLQSQGSAGVSSGAITMSATAGSNTFTTSGSITIYAGDYIVPASGTAKSVSATATGTSFSVSTAYNANITNQTFTIYHPTALFTDASGAASFIVQGNSGTVGIGTNAGAIAPDSNYKLDVAGGLNVRRNGDASSLFNVILGQNGIDNGSFEIGITGWATKGSGNAALSRNTNNSYIGDASLRIATTSGSSANDGAKYNTTLSAGTYVLSFYAETSSGTMSTLAAGYSSDGTNDTNCTLNTTSIVGTGWTKIYCSFTVVSTSGTPYLFIKQTDASTAHTYFVDAFLVEQSSAVQDFWHDGFIRLNSVVTSPVWLQNQNDSTNAFTVQNNASTGNALFNVDTLNSNVSITSVATAASATSDSLSITNTSLAPGAGITGNGVDTTVSSLATNTTGNSVVNAYNAALTVNTSGAGTKDVTAYNAGAATLTGCTTGACTVSGFKATTQSTGASSLITQNGVSVSLVGISAGTANGLNVTPPTTSTAGGTLNGLNIGSITTSNGTDNAINIGSGWDFLINSSIFKVSAASGLQVYDSAGNNPATISVNVSTGDVTFAANTGKTTIVGNGSGNIQITLSNQADTLIAGKTFTASSAYSSNDYSFTRTATGGANALSGAVVKIDDQSTTSSTNTANVLLINQATAGTGNLILAQTGGAVDKFKVSTAGTVTLAAGQSVTSAGAITLQSASGANAVTVDSGTTGNVNVGTGANAKTVTVGNTNTTSAVLIQSGTGDVTITSTDQVFVGANAATNGVTVGNATGSTLVTIQSGTGGLVLKPITSNTAAFKIQDSGGQDFMVADTTNDRLQVGSATGSSTPVILVLATKNDNASDPAGINGAMYYNSTSNTFRCYENSAWTDCLSHHVIVLGSDVTDNAGACTYTAITGLSFSVTAGQTYRFKLLANYTAAATTTGAGFSITGPASPTMLSMKLNTTLTATTDYAGSNSAYDTPATCPASSLTAANIAQLEGIITPSTSGTVQADVASEINASAIVVKAGSTLEWW